MLEMTLFCRFFAYSCLSYKRATTWSGGIIQLILIADLFQLFNCPPSGGWHISKVADIGGLLLLNWKESGKDTQTQRTNACCSVSLRFWRWPMFNVVDIHWNIYVTVPLPSLFVCMPPTPPFSSSVSLSLLFYPLVRSASLANFSRD